MAAEFVRVRLVRVEGLDLNLFDFDFDMTWAAFFLNADGRVYGRYGARDASGPDSRNTLAGLRYAMQGALEAHRRQPQPPNPSARPKPFYIQSLPAAKQQKGCIHCHNVKELRWAEAKAAGKWNRQEIWAYPLPENVGLTLDRDRGNLVTAVAAGSPAEKAGLKDGDLIADLNGYPVHSCADVQYALHRAPAKGEIPITWKRGSAAETAKANLALQEGWRRTNVTWRPSLLDLLPNMPLYGTNLSASEKKALGLDGNQLAFRQGKPVHSQAKAAGVREKDVIVGIDDLKMEMTMEQFLGHVRRNYLIGDRLTINVIREGQRLSLPLTLR